MEETPALVYVFLAACLCLFVWFVTVAAEYLHFYIVSPFKARYLTSSQDPDDDDETLVEMDIAPATTTDATPANPIATLQNDSNALLHAKADVLAALIAAKMVTQTDAIKHGLGIAPSGSSAKYREAKQVVQAAVERQTNKYPHRTEEQQKSREALNLP